MAFFLSTLNSRRRIIIGIQKRDHNFDNHSYEPWGWQSLGQKKGLAANFETPSEPSTSELKILKPKSYVQHPKTYMLEKYIYKNPGLNLWHIP